MTTISFDDSKKRRGNLRFQYLLPTVENITDECLAYFNFKLPSNRLDNRKCCLADYSNKHNYVLHVYSCYSGKHYFVTM